jgi:hypothetical protein
LFLPIRFSNVFYSLFVLFMLSKFPTYFVIILMFWRAVRTVSLLIMHFLNFTFNSVHFTSVFIQSLFSPQRAYQVTQ